MAIFKRALLLAAAAAAAFTVAAASDATDVAVAGPAAAVDAATPVDALVDVAVRRSKDPVKCIKKPIFRVKVIKIRKPVIIHKRICKRFKVPCRHRPSDKMLDTAERAAEPEPAVAGVAAEAEEAAEDVSLDAAADREGLDAEDAADEVADEEEEEEEGAAAEAEEASDALDTASRGSSRPRGCFKRKCIVKRVKIIKIIIRKKRVLVGYRKVCKRVPRH